jgi:hypothetical protein
MPDIVPIWHEYTWVGLLPMGRVVTLQVFCTYLRKYCMEALPTRPGNTLGVELSSKEEWSCLMKYEHIN